MTDDKEILEFIDFLRTKNTPKSKKLAKAVTDLFNDRANKSSRIGMLEGLVRRMCEAIESGSVDSQEIDLGDPDIPPHKIHEKWLSYAREFVPDEERNK